MVCITRKKRTRRMISTGSRFRHWQPTNIQMSRKVSKMQPVIGPILANGKRRVSQWDYATAERLLRKGAWREGVAYLGRALRLDPESSAAARQLWSAVVYGEGDRNTVPALVLRQEAKVHVAVFSPDGRRILTGSADKTARLWDATTGAPIGESMRHEDEAVDADFSHDGARIATPSKDRKARSWEAATL